MLRSINRADSLAPVSHPVAPLKKLVMAPPPAKTLGDQFLKQTHHGGQAAKTVSLRTPKPENLWRTATIATGLAVAGMVVGGAIGAGAGSAGAAGHLSGIAWAVGGAVGAATGGTIGGITGVVIARESQ